MCSKNIVFLMVYSLSLASALGQDKLTHSLKIEYFTSAHLICDHDDLNITDKGMTVNSISWIFPDGTTIDSQSVLNSKKYELSPPDGVDSSVTDKLKAFNLTILDVTDDDFGTYICVIVRNGNNMPITAIQWGLNVDGADFSKLIETYEENAVIGGIAAASMLVLVGGTCLIWNFRYSNRNQDSTDGVKRSKHTTYSNNAYKSDVDPNDVDVIVDYVDNGPVRAVENPGS